MVWKRILSAQRQNLLHALSMDENTSEDDMALTSKKLTVTLSVLQSHLPLRLNEEDAMAVKEVLDLTFEAMEHIESTKTKLRGRWESLQGLKRYEGKPYG